MTFVAEFLTNLVAFLTLLTVYLMLVESRTLCSLVTDNLCVVSWARDIVIYGIYWRPVLLKLLQD